MSTIQLTLPDELVDEARRLAASSNEPLDEFIGRAVAEHVAAVRRFEQLRERGRQRASRERFLAALDAAPDVPPVPGDEIKP